MKLPFALLALLLFPFPPTSAQVGDQMVSLQKMTLPSTGPFTGISNIFFKKMDDGRFRYPEDWKEVEVAPVMENPALVPIYAIRYRTADGGLTYAVDADGDLDFRNDSALQFRQAGDLKIADVALSIRPSGASRAASSMVDYQVLLANDGYTYTRISEYRQGQLRIGGKTYSIRLRPRGRNNPMFGLSGTTLCFIDLNRDGAFSERWHISEGGELVPREEVEIAAPFIVGGEKLRIVALDPAGTALKIEPSSEEVSLFPGFKAPEFALKGMDGRSYRLADLRGKIVLLEFWSVSCPFCKGILPEVNALIRKEAGEDFVALAVAREEDADEIKRHVRDEPRNAIVVHDKATWQTYDGPSITPTYYLIDTRGVIRLSGYGASSEQLKAIEKVVEQIRLRK